MQKHVFLRGFRGCRTMVSDASRREATYFTWFGGILARESLPGGLRKTSGGSPEAPEAARRAPRQPRDVSGRLKSTYFTWFRGGAALESLVKYVAWAPVTLQNLGLAALFSRKSSWVRVSICTSHAVSLVALAWFGLACLALHCLALPCLVLSWLTLPCLRLRA